MPNPYLWRDDPKNPRFVKYKGKSVRILICPACNTRHKMEIGGYLYMLTWWSRHTILRKAVERGIEEVRKMYS